MMRLGLSTMSSMHFLQSAFTSTRSAHTNANKEGTGSRNMTTAVAQGAISDYANIFTKEGDKVFIHSAIPAGKPPEKRMTFVKLYMYANHLIGNRCILLSDLTTLCNKEGYRSSAPRGNKTSKIRCGNFKNSFTSNDNKKLFQITSDEDGKIQVTLTDRGTQQIQNLAETLNSLDPEKPQGRLKEILTIFKRRFSKSWQRRFYKKTWKSMREV